MARRSCPPEFGRKVLDLSEAGRTVVDVVWDLELSDQTICNWRRQDRIDRGLQPVLTTAGKTELGAASRKIAALQAQLAAAKRALERAGGSGAPTKIGTRPFARWPLMVTPFNSPVVSQH